LAWVFINVPFGVLTHRLLAFLKEARMAAGPS
jgi:hypothetical protein